MLDMRKEKKGGSYHAMSQYYQTNYLKTLYFLVSIINNNI